MARHHLFARPRLVELLGARWRQRAVTLTAGPGFGKSTLLAQAVAENALAPVGVDVLVACTPQDRCPHQLLRHIASAARLDCGRAGRDASSEAIVAELTERSSLDVCLVLDDVDHVTVDDAGTRHLVDLVNDAPPRVHFVLAGRRRARGLAQARAKGAVIEIGEDALAFTDAEAARIAQSYGVDQQTVIAAGGWPAVATLLASDGLDAARAFIWESVLDHLDPCERAALALAALIGHGDVDLLREALSESNDYAAASATHRSLLANIPLVSLTDAGSFTVHGLWRAIAPEAVPTPYLHAALARATDGLLARERFDDALRLSTTFGDWERVTRVITACCGRGHGIVPAAVLDTWLDALPASRHEEPEGLLLRALASRATDPFSETTAELLERAMVAQRAVGNVAGEIAAGVQLLVVLRSQGRFDSWPAFLARAAELEAAGHVEAAGPAAVGRALLAEASNDDERMLAELATIAPGTLTRDWQLVVETRMLMSNLILGNEHEMLAAGARCVELAGSTRDRHMLAMAQWFAGTPSPALHSYEAIAIDGREAQVAAVLFGSFAAVVLASAGRVDEANRELALITRRSSGTLGVMMRGALAWARATVAVAAGNDDEAREVITAALDGASVSDPAGWRMAARLSPLAYVLIPSMRPDLDARALSGSLHRRRLDVARAVVWANDAHDHDKRGPTTGDALVDVNPDLVATTVPLRWGMALASALHGRGRAHGRVIAERLFQLYGDPARDALRATVRHRSRPTAEGARKLLASVAFAPARAVELNVLGPIELRVGDAPTTDPHWGRERVRSLLIFLALNRRVRREQIVDALWPHLEPAAADRNLRVTLTYLQQVLEPERGNGEMAFFVRQDCSTLTLVDTPALRLDTTSFDTLVERAEDASRRGLPSVALALFDEALALWRGPCLPEVAYEDWAQPVCTRLTARFVTAAVGAGELHLAAGRFDKARSYAVRALAADEWCEPAYRILISTELASGDRASALRALAKCDAMLAGLGVCADAKTDALRHRLSAYRVERPCTTSDHARHTNAPVDVTTRA